MDAAAWISGPSAGVDSGVGMAVAVGPGDGDGVAVGVGDGRRVGTAVAVGVGGGVGVGTVVAVGTGAGDGEGVVRRGGRRRRSSPGRGRCRLEPGSGSETRSRLAVGPPRELRRAPRRTRPAAPRRKRRWQSPSPLAPPSCGDHGHQPRPSGAVSLRPRASGAHAARWCPSGRRDTAATSRTAPAPPSPRRRQTRWSPSGATRRTPRLPARRSAVGAGFIERGDANAPGQHVGDLLDGAVSVRPVGRPRLEHAFGKRHVARGRQIDRPHRHVVRRHDARAGTPHPQRRIAHLERPRRARPRRARPARPPGTPPRAFAPTRP